MAQYRAPKWVWLLLVVALLLIFGRCSDADDKPSAARSTIGDHSIRCVTSGVLSASAGYPATPPSLAHRTFCRGILTADRFG